MAKTKPPCPQCGSHNIQKLVLLSRKIYWGHFIRDQEICPFRENCVNAGSGRCNLCHREYSVVRYFLDKASKEIFSETSRSEQYCQFKDREYYRKTEPFIEVHWLFVQAGKGQGA